MKKITVFLLIVLFGFQPLYSQWQQLNGISPIWVKSLASSGNNIFAGNFILLGDEKYNTGLGVWVSTNNGENWNITSLNIASSSLHFKGSRLFSCSGSLFYTDNNGTNWINPMSGLQVVSVSSNNSYVFCCGNSGLYVSSNNGVNWTSHLTNQLNYLLVKDNYVYTGNSSSLRISSDNGANWAQTSVDGKVINSLASNGSDIFAGTINGLYRSTNNGTNWNLISAANLNVQAILAFDSNLLIGEFYGNGIYKSTNLGVNWIQRNEGFPAGTALHVLYKTQYYVFAGGPSGLWRRNLQNVLLVNTNTENIPEKFSLSQNYPNPFNPSTNIKFRIKNNKYTTLKIYDVLGKEVATLVNEKLKPGEYEVTFDGSELPSGVYFYKLTTDDFTETKKMLMIK
ncbi:MAG: T9SS type A sorting domain-containing protein [Ignavibacteriae bacterium]|nr:T9SS type A sorting domain-containing protein [Ignavibacteriota bacterium]